MVISIDGLLKNLLKKIFGKKVHAYLSRTRRLITPSHLKDVIALRYHFIRLWISKQVRNPLTLPIRTESHSPSEAGAQIRVSVNGYKNATNGTKPHVLFVTEKWCDGNPNSGPSNNEHNLFGSLEASGLATQDRFHPDEYRLQNKRPFDAALLLECIRCNPDLIILTWPFTPSFRTLSQIKDRLQIPMVALWWDSVNHTEEAESFLPFVDLNIVVDSTTAYLERTHQPEKYMSMWVPQDPRIYYNPGMRRDIDACFVGTVTGHPDRFTGICALRSNGIDVYQTGGQRECRLSVDEYARVYMRSKIALNFCYHANLIPQCKSRVYEATLCGAMLLEAENSETAKRFQPMVDYVPFTDETDLVEKVRYYLAHDSERLEIAARGQQKAEEMYTGEVFWKTVFKRVFGTDF